MATTTSMPLFQMEDRFREIRRMADQFAPEIVTPDRADGRPSVAAFDPQMQTASGWTLINATVQLEELFNVLERLADTTPDVVSQQSVMPPDPSDGVLANHPAFITAFWDLSCLLLKDLSGAVDAARSATRGNTIADNRALLNELDDEVGRLSDLMRYMIVAHPEWNLTVPDHLAAAVWEFRISWPATLRALLNLFWSVIRHPLSKTTIDLSTGRVLYRI